MDSSRRKECIANVMAGASSLSGGKVMGSGSAVSSSADGESAAPVFSQSRLGRISHGSLRQHKPHPPKLYRIGEVVEYSGMSRQTIHNYTTMGLLPESRWTSGGHRLYDEDVFERLDLIAEMKVQNKSLQDIREFFSRYDSRCYESQVAIACGPADSVVRNTP